MGNPSPSGHYFNNAWRSVLCDNRPFDSPADVRKCLRHKEVIFLGDSTIRQWWEYLNSFVKGKAMWHLGGLLCVTRHRNPWASTSRRRKRRCTFDRLEKERRMRDAIRSPPLLWVLLRAAPSRAGRLFHRARAVGRSDCPGIHRHPSPPSSSELKLVDLGKNGRQDPRMALDSENSILMSWHCHTYPLITSFFTHKEEMINAAKRIDATVGGANTVIGICLGAHFTAFPLDVFRRRIGNIGAAVGRLLARSPRTKVVVKLANTCTPGSLEIFNNWNTFRMNRITMEAFAGLKVAFVDAWDMTLSVGSRNIHPDRIVVKNEVDLFLSYVC
uniref:NXPE family member 3-like n=1 Tax=Petromyzon marinus TaxID=7757 RepID=A0AAJ7UM71_PETMA|nr:NXPE family member 3-like [Petromyzon marinus]